VSDLEIVLIFAACIALMWGYLELCARLRR